MTTRRVPTALVAAVAGSLVLTGCAGGEPRDGETGTTATTAPTTSATETADLATVSVPTEFRGHTFDVEVGPVVVDGEDAFVRLAPVGVARADADPALLFKGLTTDPTKGPGGPARLLDTEGATVHDAVDWSDAGQVDYEAPVPYMVKFDAEGLETGTSTTVLVDRVGLVGDVPVLEAGADGAFDLADVADADEGEDWPTPTVAPLEAVTVTADGTTDSATSEDGVVINVASDVLFAVDSADLAPDGAAVLDELATQLEPYTSGDLAIVGHTDDVADDAYNQTLSERRAATVQAALAERTDVARFQVEVSGKGESEPRVEGTSAEARQANRRVELRLASATADTSALHALAGTEEPEPLGGTAPGPEGLSVGAPTGRVHFSMDRVVRSGGYLAGVLEARGETDGAVDPVRHLYSGFMGNLEEKGARYLPSAVTLLAGSHHVAPAVYHLEGTERRLMLVDKDAETAVDRDQVARYVMVWPDTGQDAVTVTNELTDGANGGAVPFRLTDVPVVDAEEAAE